MFERVLSIFYDNPADVVEVMAFPKSDPNARIIGHYPPNSKLLGVLEDFDTTAECDLYLGLNPVKRELRALCGTCSRANESQVPNYRHFLIDGDAIRDFIRDAAGTPILFPMLKADGTPQMDKITGQPRFQKRRHKIATKEEWQRTLEDMLRVREFLLTEGFERVPLGSSGNGVHVLPRVDLPNTPASKEMIAGVQRLLSEKFSTPHTDAQCFCDANRVVRLYGSLNRKGTPSGDRQWRRSELLYEC